MAEDLLIIPQPIQNTQASKKSATSGTKYNGPSFGEVLGAQLQHGSSEGVRFSKHATMRMQNRGIQMSAVDLTRLNQAVKMADEKGSRDSLVLLDSTALVVSVKDNTVVTVADKEQLKGNVFTNIDSAIIA
ncbi:MAG: TIGR02530 family flagellar biosynthesis protein [Desulfuromonas sp.]|nr:TIGR02530 family flagellar biosynthesis protein [Desulfuromonas sp.]